MKAERAIYLAADLCRTFEGFSSTPYMCPAGYPTIGYGATYYEDGTPVRMGDKAITKPLADARLVSMLGTQYLPAVLVASPVLAGESKKLAAILDFAYNLGNARYRASTLRKRVNESDWDSAKLELMKWTRGGGKVLPGLVKRRQAECALLQ